MTRPIYLRQQLLGHRFCTFTPKCGSNNCQSAYVVRGCISEYERKFMNPILLFIISILRHFRSGAS